MRRALFLIAVLCSAVAHAAPQTRSLDDDDDVTVGEDDDDATEEAPAVEAPVPVRTVALLQLVPGRSINSKQAQGLTARLREALTAIAEEGTLRLLPDTRDDDKVVRRCAVDADCYADVAKNRGADRLGFGTVSVDDDVGGLRITVQTTGGGEARSATFVGERSDDITRFDRLARELFAEESLRGTLVLQGQSGDMVLVDKRRRGTIGTDGRFTLERVREGSHAVEVRRPGGRNGTLYDPFTRDVTIGHRETPTIKITLLPKETTATLSDETQQGPPVLALVGVGVGAGAVVGSIVFGVLSLTTGFEVEARATQQQLVFPRDSGLVQQGRTFALVSTILGAVGVVAAGGGTALWLLSANEPSDDELEGASVNDGSLVGGAR